LGGLYSRSLLNFFVKITAFASKTSNYLTVQKISNVASNGQTDGRTDTWTDGQDL